MAAPTPYRPFGLRAVNAVGGLAQRVGLGPKLDPDHLLELAAKQAGLSDYGDDGFRDGLARLTDSMNLEARLNTIGRLAAQGQITNRLATRLALVDYRKQHPEVDAERIERPIFVLGLPRTGTTVLYGMLASNPALRSPLSWEVDKPVPPPLRGASATDPRVPRFQKDISGVDRIAPDMQHIHPVAALLPQECIAIHSIECQSYEYVVTYPIPTYFDWLKTNGIADAYRRERWVLQHLQSGYGGDHWLLKSPAHLMWPEQLLAEFPDALFIQTHRDPAKVLGSVSSLYATMHAAVSDHMDPHKEGREQFDQWTWGLSQTMKFRETLPPERVIDVAFEDTLNRPLETIQRIYDHFGLEHTPAVDQGVRDYLAANPRDKHGLHTYSIEDFGLDRDQVDEAFAAYNQRFGVSRED